jgi:hypothetical protein
MPGLSRDLVPYFRATATGPRGGSLCKRGLLRVEAAVRFSDFGLPVIETEAYLDAQGAPCVRIRARLLGAERLFYAGPLARVLEATEAPDACSTVPIGTAECPGCLDVGWRIFDARLDDDYLGEIRACRCGILSSDREALAAARAAGLSVDDLYQVISVP